MNLKIPQAFQYIATRAMETETFPTVEMFLLRVEAECLYYKLFLMALNDKCQKQVILEGNLL